MNIPAFILVLRSIVRGDWGRAHRWEGEWPLSAWLRQQCTPPGGVGLSYLATLSSHIQLSLLLSYPYYKLALNLGTDALSSGHRRARHVAVARTHGRRARGLPCAR